MIATTTRQRFPIVLPADSGEPTGRQRRFWVRALTRDEWLDYERLDFDALAGQSGRAFVEALTAKLRLVLADWTNCQGPDGEVRYDGARIAEVLTLGEMRLLYLMAREYSELTETDRKNLSSPPSGKPAACAQPATA